MRNILAGSCRVRHPINRDARETEVSITHRIGTVPSKPMCRLKFIRKNACRFSSVTMKCVSLKKDMQKRVGAFRAGWYSEGSGD